MHTYNLESINITNYLGHGIFIADVQCRHGKNLLVPRRDVLCYRYGFIESNEHLINVCSKYHDWYNEQYFDISYREETKFSTFALMHQKIKNQHVDYYVDSLEFLDAVIEHFCPKLCTRSQYLFHSSTDRLAQDRKVGVKIHKSPLD